MFGRAEQAEIIPPPAMRSNGVFGRAEQAEFIPPPAMRSNGVFGKAEQEEFIPPPAMRSNGVFGKAEQAESIPPPAMRSGERALLPVLYGNARSAVRRCTAAIQFNQRLPKTVISSGWIACPSVLHKA